METIEEDSRVRELAVTWSRCMETRGYGGLVAREDAPTEVARQWAALNGFEFVEETDGTFSFVNRDEQESTKVLDEQTLSRVRQAEVSMATADVECAGPYEEMWQRVRIEREAKFVEDNKGRLDAWLDLITVTAE